MTTKVAKLQRASLSNPVRVEVSSKLVSSNVLLSRFSFCHNRYQTVSTLLQYYLLMPLKDKDAYLIYLINSLAQKSIIMFTRTVHDAQRSGNSNSQSFSWDSKYLQTFYYLAHPWFSRSSITRTVESEPTFRCLGKI